MRKDLQEALDVSLQRYAALPMLRKLAAQSPLVPPEGIPGSPLMLVGEAPGRDEVAQGRPFVGKAGAQLDYALRRNNLRREVCWVTNSVLYRPPGNRTPYPFEVQASRPRLEEELLICLPAGVIALGAAAWLALQPWAELEGSYSEVRGKPQEMKIPTGNFSFRLLVTWHPAATFHKSNPGAKEELEAHIREFMG